MSNQKKRVKTEKDLKTREKEHDLKIKVTAKWLVLGFMSVAALSIFIFAVYYIWTHNEAQVRIIQQLINNIGSIFMGAIVILGFKISR